MRPLCLLAILCVSCGAAPPAPVVMPQAPPPIQLGGRFATIEIARAPAPDQLDHCRLRLRAGRFSGWTCGADLTTRAIPLPASLAERLDAALARVDDWGAPLAAEAADSERVVVLEDDAHHVVRIEVHAGALDALRDEAFSVATESLRVWRERGQTCSGCTADAYCEEAMACATTGPDSKDCAVRPQCLSLRASARTCEHHYECMSGHCEGTGDRVGQCR